MACHHKRSTLTLHIGSIKIKCIVANRAPPTLSYLQSAYSADSEITTPNFVWRSVFISVHVVIMNMIARLHDTRWQRHAMAAGFLY